MFHRLPIRIKLFALAAAALVVLAGGLTLLFDQMLLRALGAQLDHQAAAARPILQAALAAPAAERDYATVEAVLRESVASGSFAHMVLLDARGEPVAQAGWPAGRDGLPLPRPGPVRMPDGEERLLHAVPLSLAGQPLGTVLFGLSRAPVEQAHQELLRRSLVVALIALALLVPAVEIGSRWLFRPLRRLQRAAEALGEDRYEDSLSLLRHEALRRGGGDVARLSAAFVAMADALQARLQALAASETAQRALLEEARLRETQLRIAKERAEVAMRAKSEFLANISHEVRTPLNGILGMAQMLADSKLSEADREAVGVIVDSGRLLLAVINDILDLSRLEAGRLELAPERVDLRSVLGMPLAPIAAEARRKGLEWRVELAPDLPRDVMADRTRVAQLMLNLAGNALKFTERGSIAVAARWVPGPAGGRLRVEVQDTGIGIAPEAAGRLFQRFSQADASSRRRHRGSGLGLAIASQLAELMGGRIGFESEPGRGSLFWFEVALMPVPSETEAETGAAAPPRGIRVLVAEEMPSMRSAANAFLRRLGHEVEAVGEVEGLFDLLRRDRFDALLLDTEMPGGGPDLLRRIRGLPDGAGALPVLAFSGAADAPDRARFRAAGFAGVVPKPFRPHDLHAALQQAMAERV
ncbi:ATP-binding protein [Falsiroseomonas sp. CW058]|uniref:ATP-binding protein n=1 Tax=Falsiroseomonas sp. CW058 TaxID=3388664 RepID=UPI003D315785